MREHIEKKVVKKLDCVGIGVGAGLEYQGKMKKKERTRKEKRFEKKTRSKT